MNIKVAAFTVSEKSSNMFIAAFTVSEKSSNMFIFRCLASVVAVCVAISLMLQNKHYDGKTYDMKSIKHEAQRRAAEYLEGEGFEKYVSKIKLVKCLLLIINPFELGRVAQSVTCLATDASLTVDPGVASSIPAWSHTFMEIMK